MTRDEEDEEHVIDTTFTRGLAVHDRKTSIHHWQLRDLVSAAQNEHELYCVYDQQVHLYNSKTHQSKVVANLNFNANSMTCSHNFLAAGGLHGELEVHDLTRNEVCFKGQAGNTVNNALHVARHSNGELRLFVCCNDSSIKVYSLPSMNTCTVLPCPCPINYAALSPDGSTLVAVGDCDPTMLYKATPTGYTPLSSFNEACDVGMCCAWNQHGTLLASCHQDGTVAVWDARSGACVARMLLPTPARCLKFAAAPLDLLAVSEHEERVTLVDARAWSMRQTLTLPPHQQEGANSPGSPGSSGGRDSENISGLAFTPSGSRLWVGMERCCVGADVDSVKRRTFGVSSVL